MLSVGIECLSDLAFPQAVIQATGCGKKRSQLIVCIGIVRRKFRSLSILLLGRRKLVLRPGFNS